MQDDPKRMRTPEEIGFAIDLSSRLIMMLVARGHTTMEIDKIYDYMREALSLYYGKERTEKFLEPYHKNTKALRIQLVQHGGK